MLAMLFLACKFSVDDLFNSLMRWFPAKCRMVCGEENFTDAYYKMEYFLKHNIDEPLFRETMMKALLEMGCERSNLLLISWDNRWSSLDVKLLQPLFDQDDI